MNPVITSASILWCCSAATLALALRALPARTCRFSLGSVSQERLSLKKALDSFHELEETLESGLVPDASAWERLRALPAPWGKLSFESISRLRTSGAAVLPTIRRLRALAISHQDALASARARSAQALAQAIACAALVPVFSLVLFVLLPGVSDAPALWSLLSVVSFGVSLFAAFWLLKIAENARWGGLAVHQRPWVLAAQCAGERFLSLLRAGSAADLAWTQALEALSVDARVLAFEWGFSVYESRTRTPAPQPKQTLELALIEAGQGIKKAVQISLMEGRPCGERVEGALHGLRQEIQAHVDRELNLVATRALKPLFVCVAPSLLGLLVAGFLIAWRQALEF